MCTHVDKLGLPVSLIVLGHGKGNIQLQHSVAASSRASVKRLKSVSPLLRKFLEGVRIIADEHIFLMCAADESNVGRTYRLLRAWSPTQYVPFLPVCALVATL